MAKQKNSKCTCGAPLPDHIAELVRGTYSHVCSCYMGWKYESKTKVWTEDGKKANPFMDYDRAQKETRRAKRGIA